jgi:hypothetical protein
MVPQSGLLWAMILDFFLEGKRKKNWVVSLSGRHPFFTGMLSATSPHFGRVKSKHVLGYLRTPFDSVSPVVSLRSG